MKIQPALRQRHAMAIFRAALAAADPVAAVLKHVRCDGRVLTVAKQRYRLADFDRIQIVGAGKASARMAQALERLLKARISGGCVNVPEGDLHLARVQLAHVHLQEAGHPVPDHRGVQGAQRIARIARAAGPRDLILAVISGGASALMPLPGEGVTLAKKKQITRQLLASGATIYEMNAVRKHMSAIKGGHLAALAAPARLIALILSDVIGDDLSVIGSGPTVQDLSTVSDATAILHRYGIPVPRLTETPKTRVAAQNVIVGSNRQSITAAAAKARELGYRPVVLSTTIDGETRDIARMHAAIAREAVACGESNICFLSGGETTVTLRGKGRGGRNQEFVLAAALALEATAGITIFSAGTDGIDGPTGAAGAIANSGPVAAEAQRSLDNNDSYHYFENFPKTGGLIITGPTGTNVMDVRMLLL